MAEKTFYDIHMHSFNLSHPYLLAFVQRFKIHQLLIMNSLLGPLASLLIGANFNKIKNLLAVMENDIGSFFLLVEEYLKRSDKEPLVSEGKLHIGGNVYSRIVLTPLMMDFGYKTAIAKSPIYYNESSEKPIVEQVIDMFNGIKKYMDKSPDHLFEIYPFMGLNTLNYHLDKTRKTERGRLDIMLDKYFSDYHGSRQELYRNLGKFNGDINLIGSNYFAGVKVYPPLGFDPWPDSGEELVKVKYLYDYCARGNIPITAHGSESGFVVVPKNELKKYTLISKWRNVLQTYPNLKLNLAHFPVGEKYLWLFPKKKRLQEIIGLVRDFDNFYVDFACRALTDEYYVLLKQLIDGSPAELKARLNSHILFGSDFTINLMSIESYNKYLGIFSQDKSFNDHEKDIFCSVNPERFLFSGSPKG